MKVRPAVPVESRWLAGRHEVRYLRVADLVAGTAFRIKLKNEWYYFLYRGNNYIELVGVRNQRRMGQPSVRLLGPQGTLDSRELFTELPGCIAIGHFFVAQLIGSAAARSIGRVMAIEYVSNERLRHLRRDAKGTRCYDYLAEPVTNSSLRCGPGRRDLVLA